MNIANAFSMLSPRRLLRAVMPATPPPPPPPTLRSRRLPASTTGHGMMTRVAPRRSLLLLAAVLAALAVFLVGDGVPPAQAGHRTTVWSATLTPGDVGAGIYLGCWNTIPSAMCSSTSVLTDDDITYNGVTYTINRIASAARNEFILDFDKAIPASFEQVATLFVDGVAYPLSDEPTTPGNTAWTWTFESDPLPPTWSIGDTVELSLTAPPQPTVTLVSNTGQTADPAASVTTNTVLAQGFTTGSNAAGYALTSVGASLANGPSGQSDRDSIRAEVWSDDGSSGGAPGAKLYDLAVPASVTTGIVDFAAPEGALLAPGARYYLVIYTTGAYNMGIGQTDTNAEDTGAAPGFSIDNRFRFINAATPGANPTWTTSSQSEEIRIAVKGSAVAATATATTFVSTTGQTDHPTNDGARKSLYSVHAQAFTTGTHSGGYTLSGIDLVIRIPTTGTTDSIIATELQNMRAELWSDDGGEPDSKLADLAKPSSLSRGTNTITFTAPPGVTLAASATYHFVIYSTGTNGAGRIHSTNSDGQDSGAATGWSVADTSNSIVNANSVSGTWHTTLQGLAFTLRMAVKGFENPAPGLSHLAASWGRSASGAFRPLDFFDADGGAFSSAAAAYAVSVENAISHVKLTPIVNDARTTLQVGKAGSLAAVASGAASAAVALDEGDNEIIVRATAADGATTKDYTVTVTRLAAADSVLMGFVDEHTLAAAEGKSIDVLVGLSAALATDTSVTVTQTGGSAAHPDDYTLSASTFSFPAGRTRAPLRIDAVADMTTDGGEESAILGLEAPTGAPYTFPGRSSPGNLYSSLDVAIFDDSREPGLHYDLGRAGFLAVTEGGSVQVNMFLGSPAAQDTEITLSVLDSSTAVLSTQDTPADFSLSAVPDIETGLTTAHFTVTARDDSDDEPIEYIVLQASGGGHTSDPLVIYLLDNDDAPHAPYGVTATPGDKSITVAWFEVSDATGYTVQYKTADASSWTDHTDTGDDRSRAITGLTNNTPYDVRVRADNDDGNSPWAYPNLWEAALTVQTTANLRGCVNAECTPSSGLTDDKFTVAGQEYEVTSLVSAASSFQVSLGTDVTDAVNALDLRLGDTVLRGADATVSTQVNLDWTTAAHTLPESGVVLVGLSDPKRTTPRPDPPPAPDAFYAYPASEALTAVWWWTDYTFEGDDFAGYDVEYKQADAPDLPPAVWEATLTVQTTSVGSGCYGGQTGKECSNPEVLSDGTFTYGGRSYEISRIAHIGTTLTAYLGDLDSITELDGLLLDIEGFAEPLSLADATHPGGSLAEAFAWSSDSFPAEWTADDMVKLRLLRADPSQGWVDAGHDGGIDDENITITGLTNGAAYDLRARLRVAGAPGPGAWATAQGTPERTTAVWTATLTAKDLGGEVGCDNDDSGKECSDSSVLTDPDFRYAGADYAFFEIAHDASLLTITFDPVHTAELKEKAILVVDGAPYPLRESDVDGALGLAWGRTPGWTAEQSVELSLEVLGLVAPETPAGLEARPAHHGLWPAWTAQDQAAGYDVQYREASAPEAAATIWEATLTPNNAVYLGCVSDLVSGSECALTGVLSEDGFTHDGVDYQITELGYFDGGSELTFRFNKDIPADIRSSATLHVDGTALRLADASRSGNNGVSFINANLAWSVGEPVQVRLMRGDPATGWVDAGHDGADPDVPIPGLTEGTTYEVRVRALNAAGESGWATAQGAAGGTPVVGFSPTAYSLSVSGGTTNVATLTLSVSPLLLADSSATLVLLADDPEHTVRREETDHAVWDAMPSVTLPAGKASVDYETNILDDNGAEQDVKMVIGLRAVDDAPYTTGETRAVITIPDEDTMTISFHSAEIIDDMPVFRAAEGGSAALAVVSDRGAGFPVTVTLAGGADADTATLDATETTDYVLDAAATTFPAGVSIQTPAPAVGVRIIADSVSDDGERLLVTLTLPGGLAADQRVQIGPDPALVIIGAATATTPTAPTGLAVSAESHDQLTLTWIGPPETATGYDVQYKAETATGWSDAGHTGVVPLRVIAGLDDGVLYDVRVRAVNSAAATQQGPWAAAQGATPEAPRDEKPRVSISASPNPVREGSPVTITATLSRALGVDVTIPVTVSRGSAERDDVGALAGIDISAGSTTGTGVITTTADTDTVAETFGVSLDQNLLPAGVRVGSPSRVTVVVTEGAPVDVPNKVVASVKPGNARLTVTWQLPTVKPGDSSLDRTGNPTGDPTGYEVQYREHGTAGWTAAGNAAMDGAGQPLRTFIISSLTNGTTYDVRVRASNAHGAGEWSNAVQGRPMARPGAVRNLVAAPGFGQVTVTWDRPAAGEVVQYFVQYRKSTDTEWENTFAGPSRDRTRAIYHLESGTAYDVRVRGVNDIGDGLWTTASVSTYHADAPSSLGLGVAPVPREGRSISVPSDVPVGESTLYVRLNRPALADLTVTFTTGGTATYGANGDWTLSAATATIAAGEDVAELKVRVVDDDVADPDETIVITGRVAGTTSGPPLEYTVTLTIIDNDEPDGQSGSSGNAPPEGAGLPTAVELALGRTTVGESAGSVTLTATLDAPAPDGGIGGLLLAGEDGTASADVDFTMPFEIFIPGGQRSGTATITITGDDLDEADETVVLSALFDTGTALLEDQVTLTITDDDTAGVTVSAPNPLNVSEGGTATYTVVLDSEPTADVTITAASADGSKVSVSPASVTFTPSGWNTPRAFTVSGVADADSDDETVTVSHRATGADAGYNGIIVNTVRVQVSDATASGQQGADDAGPEPADVQVTPGDGTLTVTWTVTPREGFADNEIRHALRWSQVSGVWANPPGGFGGGPEDGIFVEGGVTSYVITGLTNDVATGVFVRSFTGASRSERSQHSSQWVRTKGDHTTPRASQSQQQQDPPNSAPTVSAAIGDATIVNESGTQTVSLSGVFADADNDALTVTAASSDTAVATASVSSDHSTLTVSARSRGTATVTVTADDGNGGTASDSFTVTVKAAPTVASALADVSGMEVGSTRDVSLSGVFSDADGDALTVTTNSSDDAVANAWAFQGTLTVTAISAGSATITVTAQDADGNSVSDTFDVEVVEAPEPEPDPQTANQAPTVAASLAGVTIIAVGGEWEVSLSGVFEDADGDDLTITAASSDDAVAAVSVAADQSTLTVTGVAGGEAAITVTAQDADGNTVSDALDVQVVKREEGSTQPTNIRIVAGDGALTVSWTVTSRDGVEDDEIKHALRWSQVSGVWANPRDPYGGGPEDGISVEGGVASYTITGLQNGVATGVFVRSFTGSSHSERSDQSSKWVRVKGEHTTPRAE